MMRNIGRDMRTMGSEHRRDGYIGPIASTGSGGKLMNVNNLNNSQLRDLLNMSPYGISSRGNSGMKAQVMVNDDSNNAVVGIYDPDKPEVDVGETILYSDGGCIIYLDKDGNINMSTGEAKISMNKNGSIVIEGDVVIKGTFNRIDPSI